MTRMQRKDPLWHHTRTAETALPQATADTFSLPGVACGFPTACVAGTACPKGSLHRRLSVEAVAASRCAAVKGPGQPHHGGAPTGVAAHVALCVDAPVTCSVRKWIEVKGIRNSRCKVSGHKKQ